MELVKKIIQKTFLTLLGLLIISCSGGDPSISILPLTENFSDSQAFNLKLDILWVVDPSRSMFEESERVRENIAAFMEDIIVSKYEYRVGVISSAAWSELAYNADPSKSFLVDSSSNSVFNRLHKGECLDYAASSSNPPYLSYLNTLNLGSFLTNFNRNFDIYGAGINTSGCGLVGPPFSNYNSVSNNIFADPQFNSSEREKIWEYANDERPLQSMKTFLSSAEGSSFIRPDAFLAVILITDEDDGSRDDLSPSLSFEQSSGLGHTAASYTSYLEALKGGSENYNVYSIIKTDGSNTLNADVANNSGGSVIDIDGTSENYAQNLESMKNAILTDSSLYALGVLPIPETISVIFTKSNGIKVFVPFDSGSGGFTYIPSSNSLKFSAPFIPGSGDAISVFFDPVSLNGPSVQNPFLKISGDQVSEDAANGTSVGTVSVVNAGEASITYAIVSDSSGGAFSIGASSGIITVVNSSLLDTETQALQSLKVSAFSSTLDKISRDFVILISDVVDSTPVAGNDQFIVSENSVDSMGNIKVNGNTSYNDTQIDISESHVWALTNTATQGLASLSSAGVLEYTVSKAALGLGSGDVHTENLTYTITDATGNVSNTGTITITIEGANSSPKNDLAIPDQIVNIIGGVQEIALDDASFLSTGLSSGSAADGTDGNGATGLVTTSPGASAHYLQYSFTGASAYEVTRIEVDSSESMGNTILQVISNSNQVLTREVAELNIGNSIVVPFSTPTIGKKIKIIRPSGAVNTALSDDIKVSEVRAYGYEVSTLTINLSTHFSDSDLGDTLTYYATDKFGEGPAPGWVKISGNVFTATPPAGTDTDIGILVQDSIGATAFTVFNIKRTGGSTVNSAPIALLAIDDTQRGGLTLKRFGGNSGGAPLTDSIEHDEADEFLDQALDSNGDLIYPDDPGGFEFETDHNPSGENGWDPLPSLVNNKFAQGGRLIPLVDTERKYGETYTGYFAPAKSGVYRFRTTQVDDVVRLLISPSEYVTDLQRVITGTIDTLKMRNVMIDSLVYSDALGLGITSLSSVTNSEFFPNSWGSGHDTSRFFQGGILGYTPGYVHLNQGNAYAFQVRFMEGGGAVAFDFEFDYKPDAAGSWDGWRPVDAAVLIPNNGADSYSEREVPSMGSVDFEGSSLFYDAEQDILEYSARLVLPDGTDFIGPGSTSDLSEIGLSVSSTTGQVTGALNLAYTGASIKPRLLMTATEKFTVLNRSSSALSIKFNLTTAP